MSSRLYPLSELQRSDPDDAVAWTLSRYAALLGVLQARGLVDNSNAPNVAAAIVAHWYRETGGGRGRDRDGNGTRDGGEYRFNTGNIKDGTAWHGDGQVLPDGLHYRAYGSLADGVSDTVALLTNSRYGAAFNYLVSTGDAYGWYDRLMRAGWHPWSAGALDQYDSILNTVRRTVSLAPVTPPVSDTGKAVAVGVVTAGAFLAWWLTRKKS